MDEIKNYPPYLDYPKPYKPQENTNYIRAMSDEDALAASKSRMFMSIKYPCIYWNDGLCKKFSDDKSTSWCVEGPCSEQVPSNADRIRSMTDEELKEFICSIMQCKFCKFEGWGGCELLKWLQQPSRGE